jgi:hypothetical protein
MPMENNIQSDDFQAMAVHVHVLKKIKRVLGI